jgi:ABC-type transporter Mla MlaB component
MTTQSVNTIANDKFGIGAAFGSLVRQLTGRRKKTAKAVAVTESAPRLTIERIDSAESDLTTFHLIGEIDSTTYEIAIDAAHQAYFEGARRAELDFSAVSRISKSGLYALTSIALTFDGEQLLAPEYGRATIRAASDAVNARVRSPIVIVNANAEIAVWLNINGFGKYFQVVA